MDWLYQNDKRSQLGQILLGKKLISEDLLNKAIEEQGRSGKRLGEILADWKVITDRQIQSAIRRQRNLRLAAGVATALLGPLQAYAAVAVAPAAAVAVRSLNSEKEDRGAAEGAGTGGSMRPLTDEELGSIAAQGIPEQALQEQARHAEMQLSYLNAHGTQIDPARAAASIMQTPDGMRVLTEMSKIFNPLSMLLGATTTVKDVVYDPANSVSHINKDGSITLRLPSTIGEISFKNIRVAGATSGPSFGSIDIKNIDLRGTTITVTPR
ncbi:hypothetical protein E4L96_11365 [Massilia arenosa]|uniref:Uncharacterized protein n=1 Tax=Zemynaea arenosa TaxID=2561931 RepID=A0A4Y9SBZ1_9BURK|nr:hypothetical protein [Massilia arenosa]TFW19734.1 hypothetical protein E4L96_11365 [Massilia arenosa]